MKFDSIIGSTGSVLTNYIAEQLDIPIVKHVRTCENVITTEPVVPEGTFALFAIEEMFPTQVLEKYNLIASPYYDIVENCNKLGFHCLYVPFSFKVQKVPLGNKIIAPKLTENMLLSSTETLYYKESNFEPEDWAVVLNKKVVRSTESFRDYFAGAKICLVDRPDSFYAQYARACGVPCDQPACTKPSKTWNGINFTRSITERDTMHRYKRWEP